MYICIYVYMYICIYIYTMHSYIARGPDALLQRGVPHGTRGLTSQLDRHGLPTFCKSLRDNGSSSQCNTPYNHKLCQYVSTMLKQDA